MPLVPAKCPNCGGNVVVDNEKDAWICDFCKTPFIVEKAINNFNTVNNIVNNNEIKADVVNVYNGINIDEDINNFNMRLYMAKRGNPNEWGIYTEIDDILYDFKKFINENMSNVSVHVAYFETLIDLYHFTLDGNEWKGEWRLENLIKEYELIEYLDKDKFEECKFKINQFYNRLHSVIIEKVNTSETAEEELDRISNSDDIEGEITEWNYGVDENLMNTLFLANDFIKYKMFPKEYEAKYNKNISPIIEAGKKLGIKCVYGRFAIVNAYYYDDGKCPYNKSILLSNSFTDINLLATYADEKRVRFENEIEEDRKQKEEEHLNLCKCEKICPECLSALSIFGKCKTKGCKNYNRKVF